MLWDFPGGSVVGSLPANAGDTDSVSKISHAMGQLSQCTTSIEPIFQSPHATNAEALEPVFHKKRSKLNEKPMQCNQPLLTKTRENLCTAMKSLCTATNTAKKEKTDLSTSNTHSLSLSTEILPLMHERFSQMLKGFSLQHC